MRKSSRLRVWYRYLRRRSRALRRMCVSFLTIAMAIAKVIEFVVSLYSSWSV